MKSDSVVSFLRNVTVSCAKCSTAMRMLWAMVSSAEPEAHAGMRQPAGHADRRAVGAPAGRAGQHAVLAELDRIHAARNRCHLDDLMAQLAQFGANAFRDRLL